MLVVVVVVYAILQALGYSALHGLGKVGGRTHAAARPAPLFVDTSHTVCRRGRGLG